MPESQKYRKQPVQPRDARIISLILQSLGVEDFDPKVVHQLLEFAHRYTMDVFQDALVYAEHANKTDIDLDDVQLAIQGRVNHSFTNPPPKELLLELAEEKNKAPLPLIPEKYGIRLPAEKHCLTGINFSIVPDAPLPPQPIIEKSQSQYNPEGSQEPFAPVDFSDIPMDMQSTQSPGLTQTDAPAKRSRDAIEDDDYDF